MIMFILLSVLTFNRCTMGSKLCCNSSSVHVAPSDKETPSISRTVDRKRSWRKTSLVYPAPPRHEPARQRSSVGSFTSRASLRIFNRTATETSLNCVVEDFEDTMQRMSMDNQIMQKYRVKRIIGKGNFSRVLKVEDKLSNFEYAMKIVERTSAISISCEREMEILKRVHHPNIVHLYEVHKAGRKMYLLLELASGGDLCTKLKKVGHFQEHYTRRIIVMMLDALEYLHKHGVTHRDLKLENCLFKTKDKDSIIVLSDFGLAHLQLDSCKKEAMQTTCGTEEYISPEMLNGDLYTNRIDIWALGVIMYAMLSGSMPFQDDTRMKMYRKIMDGSFSLTDEVWLSVSLQAKEFMSHLLCVNPQIRYSAEIAQKHSWIANVQQ